MLIVIFHAFSKNQLTTGSGFYFPPTLLTSFRYVSQPGGAKHLCAPASGSEYRPPAQTEEARSKETLPALQSQTSVNNKYIRVSDV